MKTEFKSLIPHLAALVLAALGLNPSWNEQGRMAFVSNADASELAQSTAAEINTSLQTANQGLGGATATSCGSAPKAPQPIDCSSLLLSYAKNSGDPIRTLAPSSGTADLSDLGQRIGNVPLVGLGEVTHGAHEPMEFKLRFFQYLVEKKGFRVLSMESGLLEGNQVEKYVQGDPSVKLNDVLAQGFTHNMGDFTETQALVEWMRSYNQTQRDPAAKVHYVGFDFSDDGDSPALPLQALAPYLQKVDPTYYQGEFQNTLALANESSALTQKADAAYRAAGASGIDGDYVDAVTTLSWEQLTPAEQQEFAAEVGDLVKRMAQQKASYLKNSSPADYAWYSHMPQLVEQYLRDFKSRETHKPIAFFDQVVQMIQRAGIDPGLKSDESHALSTSDLAANEAYQIGRSSRELADAENVEWAQQLYGKTLVYAHDGHLAKASSTAQPAASTTNAGAYLADKFKDGYLLIATDTNTYVDSKGNPLQKFQGAPIVPLAQCNGCLEGALTESMPSGAAALAIDLQNATGATRSCLDQSRDLRYQSTFEPYDLLKSFDILMFVPNMTPGTPLTDPSKQ